MNCNVICFDKIERWFHEFDAVGSNEKLLTLFDDFRRWCLDVFKLGTTIENIRVYLIEDNLDFENRNCPIKTNEEFVSILKSTDYEGFDIVLSVDVNGKSNSVRELQATVDLRELDCKEELVLTVKIHSKSNARAWDESWNNLRKQIILTLEKTAKRRDSEWQKEFGLQSRSSRCGLVKTSGEYCELLMSIDSSQKIVFQMTVK